MLLFQKRLRLSRKVEEGKPLPRARHHRGGQVVRTLAVNQELTLVRVSAQPEPCWSHLCLSPCLIDWGKIMHPTYPTKCANVEPNSGRV